MDLRQIHMEDEFVGQDHQHFSALSACMRFMFGKTSLASSLMFVLCYSICWVVGACLTDFVAFDLV